MTTPPLLHATLGLRAARYRVERPDLSGGAVGATVTAGFVLRERLGDPVARGSEAAAAAALSPDALPGGLSPGTGPVSASPRPGTPAAPDRAGSDRLGGGNRMDGRHAATAARQGATPPSRPPRVGPLFADAPLPDHDAAAAALLRERAVAVPASLDSSSPERPLR